MPANTGYVAVRKLNPGNHEYPLDFRKVGKVRRSHFCLEILDCRKSQISLLGKSALRPFQKSARGSALFVIMAT